MTTTAFAIPFTAVVRDTSLDFTDKQLDSLNVNITTTVDGYSTISVLEGTEVVGSILDYANGTFAYLNKVGEVVDLVDELDPDVMTTKIFPIAIPMALLLARLIVVFGRIPILVSALRINSTMTLAYY